MLIKKLIFLLNHPGFPRLMYLLLFILTLGLNYLHKNKFINLNNLEIFFIWLALFLQALLWFILDLPHSPILRLRKLLKAEGKLVLIIIFVALLVRLLFLVQYPFHLEGDGLRDAGLYGFRMKIGQMSDPFDLGAYQGYGNFIPLISYFFSIFLNNSILIYRLPSAIVGVLSIIFTYFVARVSFNKRIAVVSSLLLIFSFVHMHYGRTELLIIMDSLLSVLIILVSLYVFSHKNGFFVFGLIVGLSLHFYAGIRGVIAACLLYIFIRLSIDFAGAIGTKKFSVIANNVKSVFLYFLFFIMGLIIALGPTINFFDKNNLVINVGTTHLIYSDNSFREKSIKEKIVYTLEKVEKSYLVYVFEPTLSAHFRYHAPLLSFPLNWFFIVGLIALIINKKGYKKSFRNLILINILIIPITNQVLVGEVGVDHRLMSVVPLLNIVSAWGLIILVEKIVPKLSKLILILFLAIFLIWQLCYFYSFRLSEQFVGKDAVKEYVFQEALYNLNYYPADQYYLLNNTPFNYEYIHYKEKIEFLTYPKKVELLEKDKFLAQFAAEKQLKKSSDVFITFADIPEFSAENKKTFVVSCQNKKSDLLKFNCPKDFRGDYKYQFIFTQ